MVQLLDFLILPKEVTEFERDYLARLNRIAFGFFALHLPAFTLIAWANETRPGWAALLTLAVLIGPLLAQRVVESPRTVSVVYGVTAMFMGGLLVHFGQGPVQIEMHFYFFALIAMCAVFGNPLVVVAAAVTVALHHWIVWLVLPRSVFNYDAEWWVVAVHAAFVVLESVAACFIARAFFDNVIGLERIVRARTEALDSKNRDMHLLLDNVQQGFLTIDQAGLLAQERSAAIERWFGAPEAGASWFDYLKTVSPAFSARSRIAWDEVVEGTMPFEVTLGQMPARLAVQGSHYRFDYRPIGSSEPFERYLVMVTDVTTEVARELAELEQAEAMALFERVLVDRPGFQEFFEEAGSIVDVIVHERSKDPSTVKRLLHTLKGNAGLYRLNSVADLCHDLESYVAEEGALPPAIMYEGLRTRWARVAANIQTLLGTGGRKIELDDEEYEALETAVRAGESGPALLRRVRGLRLEATSKRLRHFEEQAKRIAERLDKGSVKVKVEAHDVRLDHARWAGFWAAFVHAVRNAIDHGIETPDERLASGKEESGTLALRTFADKDQLVVEIADDGRGIDWGRVAKRAAAAGLPATTPSDLERAIFVDGITTAAEVTDMSGRGVGMGALLDATRELGGEIAIKSTLQMGTTVRFTFPAGAARPAEAGYPLAVAQ